MSQLFRQAALSKVSHPDQLDDALRIVPSSHKLGLFVAALVILGGFVWSTLSTAPETVIAQGVLLSLAGVSAVQAPDSGTIDSLRVSLGEAVAQGDVVALLDRPDLLERVRAAEAELRDARERLLMLREMERANAAPRAELDDRKRHGLLQREANLSRQSAALRDRLANEQAMRRRGFVTDSQVIETRARIAEVENDLATIRGNLTELDVTNNENRARREREIRDAQLKVASLERDLETRKSEYTRGRTAFAPTSGTVVEVVHNPGDMITSGGTILRLLSGSGEEDSLSAIVYVPDTEGKKVKVGMEARIIPTTVKVEKSGFILARVTKVAELPATRDGLMRRLKNAALVDRLMGSGAPFEVEVALERADTPSGYRWSSGQGPDLTVDAGTMAEARVVVGRTPIIVLALPALNHLYRWADAL